MNTKPVRQYIVVNKATHKAFHPDGWTTTSKAKKFENIRLAGNVVDMTKNPDVRIARA